MAKTNETSVEEVLRELDSGIRDAIAAHDQYRIGFLTGRAFEITRGMDEHPEWWDHGCGCDLCMSYE